MKSSARWAAVGLLALACGPVKTSTDASHTKGVIDAKAVEVYVFNNKGESDPEVSPEEIPLVAVTEGNGTMRGYRIDCSDKYDLMLRGFGYNGVSLDDLYPIAKEDALYQTLKVDQQPVLRCINDNESQHKAQIDRIFRVVDLAKGDTRHFPYYLKFANQPDLSYSVGCENFSKAFGWDLGRESIPVTTAFIDDQFPEANRRELNCYQGREAVAPTPNSRLPVHVGSPVPPNQVQIYRIKDTGLFKDQGLPSTFPYVLSQGFGFPVSCGANTSMLFKALGFPDLESSKLNDLDQGSPLFKNSQPKKQPVLRCIKTDPTRPLIKTAYEVINEQPKSVYVRFQSNPKVLVRLGCPGLETLYELDRSKAIPITKESLSSLVPKPDPGMRNILDLSCQVTGPAVELIEQAYAEVFGIDMDKNVAKDLSLKLGTTNHTYSYDQLVEYFVSGQAALEHVHSTCLRATMGRAASVEYSLESECRVCSLNRPHIGTM